MTILVSQSFDRLSLSNLCTNICINLVIGNTALRRLAYSGEGIRWLSSESDSTSKDECIDSAADEWQIVVNNADTIPLADGNIDPDETFASYNSASINTQKFVVFRARSTGGGEPETGVFVRDMVNPSSDIVRQGNCFLLFLSISILIFIIIPCICRYSIHCQ